MPPTQQTPFSDRYRLERIIGRGGMGAVWLATDVLLGRSVAIKEVVLPAAVADDERQAAHARFVREAHAAARVTDPAVVTVHDIVADEERLFLVMEHVDARSLEQKVADDGPLLPAEAAALGARIAGALAAAHECGVVHRDVKPSNILLPDGGSSAKLVDFGIAAIADDPRITATGLVIGSPSYLAPEQADGHPATAASDVFSLGATVYFAVEGEDAFRKDTAAATLAAVGTQPPRDPRRAGPLGPVVLAMVDKDPGRRPSMPEVARRLAEVAGTPMPPADQPRPRVVGPATRPVTALQHRPASDGPTGDTRKRRKLPWVAAAAGLVAALTAAGVIVAARDGGDPQAGTTTAAAASSTEATASNVPATFTTVAATSTTVAAASSTAAAATTTGATQPPAIPAGFVEYVDPQGGFRMLVPESFGLDVDADRRLSEFTDGHTSVAVRWFEPGIDPVGYLGREEQRIAALPHYTSLALREESFGEFPGSFWEFEFAFNGNQDRLLHSTGRVFAVGEYTFGLWFRAPVEEFEALRVGVFSVVEGSFQPIIGQPQEGQ